MQNEAPSSLEYAKLAEEVRDLRFVVRLMWVTLTGVAAFFSFRVLNDLPGMEKIFQDMLGDKSKLPAITKAVLEWSRLGGGLLAPWVLGGISAIGIGLPWFIRNMRVGAAIAVSGMLVLFIHWAVCWAATTAPLIEVVRGLAGSSQ